MTNIRSVKKSSRFHEHLPAFEFLLEGYTRRNAWNSSGIPNRSLAQGGSGRVAEWGYTVRGL